jgi:hypothetical protein
MESEKYLEGQSMQRLPLFESDGFLYWKNRFEFYVKSKDLDLWHVITNGDFPPVRSPFSKHKYDIKRNKMRNKSGWLWDNMKGESARVSLMKSNNQQA